jgi:hypothetical protein
MLFLLFQGIFSFAFATQDKGVHIEFLRHDARGSHFVVHLTPPDFRLFSNQDGNFIQLQTEDLYPAGRVGGPMLPVLRTMVELPQGAEWTAEVCVLQYIDYNLDSLFPGIPLYPQQPPLCKDPDSLKPFRFAPAHYLSYSDTLPTRLQLTYTGMMRNFRLGEMEYAPFAYKHSTKRLVFASEVEIRIVFSDHSEETPSVNMPAIRTPFFPLPANQVLGGGLPGTATENITSEPQHYVIVSHPMFQDSLQPFIEWKRRKGFIVTEAYTNQTQVGSTTSSIKNFLQGLYQNATPALPAPVYLLLVGDVGQIPAHSGTTGSHITDLYYAEYTGDYFPDLYYGRFSANNIAELMPQIRKTLEYEQYLMPDDSFLDDVVMIAGVDSWYASTHGNGQINYGTDNYFNTANGITAHTYLYPASGSSPVASQIRSKVSQGAAFVNYTAHGGTGGWSDPAFNTTHIAALSNAGKYPLMIGNACLTNSFQINACFGEALLRADGKGALGYIGASNNTYWDEDFYWGVGLGSISSTPAHSATGPGMYDRWWHTHGEPYSDWYVTQGQMITSGNLAVQSSSSSRKKYYWEVYHLMGDPSLMIYQGPAPLLSVQLPAFILPTDNTISLQTEPYAYIAVNSGGQLLGTGLADSAGNASFLITPVMNPGQVEVVGTAQNRRPFIGNLPVLSPTGAYPLAAALIINDSAGNQNAQADFGERIHLNLPLENTGGGTADSVIAVLHCSDPYISLELNEARTYNLGPGDRDTLISAFCLHIDPMIPDQYVLPYSIEILTDTDTLLYSHQMILNAPRLQLNAFQLTEISGNGNGKPDPGEQMLLSLDFGNAGHADASQIELTITALSPYLIPTDTSILINGLNVGQVSTLTIPFQISPSCPSGYTLRLLVGMKADSGRLFNDTLEFMAGSVHVAIIDLDPNGNAAPGIQHSISFNGISSAIIDSVPDDLSAYSAVFVCLGVYSNNHPLTSAEGTRLKNYLDGGGNLYMEGGDTWAYDPATAVHPMFYINGLSDGSADLSLLQGNAGTFTSGFSLYYNGENNWIDRLAPLGNAFVIFSNQSPAYSAAIACTTSTYRTIGKSFEFAGLSNGFGSNTRHELMRAYLEFFGLIGQDLIPGLASLPIRACQDSLIMFNDSSQGTVASWFWEFPGGQPSQSSLPQPQVSYANAGLYDVYLTISDGIQAVRTAFPASVEILEVVSILASPQDTMLAPGHNAAFNASASQYTSVGWEMSQDAGLNWTVLQDGALFSGAQTENLSVHNVLPAMDGSWFRFFCEGECGGQIFSQKAVLEVDMAGVYGYVYYANADSTLLPEASLHTSGTASATANADSTAWYRIPLVQPGMYTLTATTQLPWSSVNATDALKVMRYFVGLDMLDGIVRRAADVDATGYVNATDALMISRRFTGLLPSFPAGDWISDSVDFYFDGLQPVQGNVGMLCVGDVDLSYALAKGSQNALLPGARVSPGPDGIALLPIEVQAPAAVGALSLLAAWPPCWELLEVTTPLDASYLDYSLDNGQFRLSWFSLQPHPAAVGGPALIWLKIRHKIDAGSCKSLFINNAEIADAKGNVLPEAILLQPQLESQSMVLAGQPYPNPTKDQLWLPLDLPRDTKVRIRFYSLEGRLLGNAFEGVLSGQQILPLSLKGLSGGLILQLDAEVNGEEMVVREKVLVIP